MAISKEQWTEIKQELRPHHGVVKLKHADNSITLVKTQVSENELAVMVYINDVNCQGWGIPSSDEFKPELKPYLSSKKQHRYSHKRKKEIIKAFGKRQAKKDLDVDGVFEYWSPFFNTFSTLKGIYNKLDGLELISIGGNPFVEAKEKS